MNPITLIHADNIQAAFDRMVRHLASMKERSVDSAERCVYRADDGNRCVVGALIPDDQYKPTLEQLGTVTILHLKGVLKGVRDEWVWVARSMQGTHDDERNWNHRGFSGWDQLRKVAGRHNLDPSVIDEVTAGRDD